MNRIHFCLLAQCIQLSFLEPSNKDRSMFNVRLSRRKFVLFFWSLIFRFFFCPFPVFLRTFLCAALCNVHRVLAVPVCASGQEWKSALTFFSGNSRATVEISPTHTHAPTHVHTHTHTHTQRPLWRRIVHYHSCFSNYINWYITEHRVDFRPDCIREVFTASEFTVIYY